MMFRLAVKVLALGLALGISPLRAETRSVTIAQQYGIAFVPLMFMEKFKLIEKNTVEFGLPEPDVKWIKLAGPSMMNDGLLSGVLSFASTGAPALALLWDKSKGGVKGVGMICSYSLFLNTRNPNVRTVADLGQGDRIAVSSVKISLQAIRTQMMAEQLYGTANFAKLDPLTVTLSHPDAMNALLNAQSEINAHYAPSPYHEREIVDPRIRTIAEVRTAVFLTASERFRTENPLTFKATLAALREAIDMINADQTRAVDIYRQLSADTTPPDELRAQMFDPRFKFSAVPETVEEIASFMHRVGTIKRPVSSWKDLFFPEAHHLPGN